MLSGRYVAGSPQVRTTGRARFVCENAVFLVASTRESDDSVTLKSGYESLEELWTGRTTNLSWNLALSMPPKRIDPVGESDQVSEPSSQSQILTCPDH